MRFHRVFVVAVVAVLAGPALAAETAHASPAASGPAWSPRLISSESLYDGSAVRMRYTEGITVVASAGSMVVFKNVPATTAASDGRRVYHRAVQVVGPQITRQGASVAAAQYAAAGRSVYSDAVAAGFSQARARDEQSAQAMQAQSYPILKSWCIRSEDQQPDPNFSWDGCAEVYDVDSTAASDAWYFAASSTAHGWGTGVLGGGKELDRGYTQLDWSSTGGDGQIVDASPSAKVSGSGNGCGSYNIGLSSFGVSLGYSASLCDDGWDVTWTPTTHKVEWHGASTGGSSDSRSASGANTYRTSLDTTSVSLKYNIGWTVACLWSC